MKKIVAIQAGSSLNIVGLSVGVVFGGVAAALILLLVLVLLYFWLQAKKKRIVR